MVKLKNNVDRVKVFSSFIRKGKHIFRHSTYLQFGDSTDAIGGCVLCNPGTSYLKGDKAFKNLADGDEIRGHSEMDPTMIQLKKIVEKTHGENVSGRFYIYNLLTLRNGGITEATNYYKRMCRDGEYEELLNRDFTDFKDNVNKLPWVLIGWGCSGAKILTEKKEEWIGYINDKNIVNIGVNSIQNPVFYKHPCPTGSNQKSEIEKLLIEQINKVIK